MARRKSRTVKDKELDFYKEMNFNNVTAIKEGPKKKTFHAKDLKDVRPMNETQREFFVSYLSGNHVIGNGSAGTGKSFISLYLALNDVLDNEKEQDRLIIVRSAVPSREIGHLPGDLNEKMVAYEEPYKAIVADLMRRPTAYTDMKDAGKIEFMPTSFVRGLTWDNAVVILDEAQSCTFHEINSVITRLGKNSKLIVCGDISQNDLIVRRSDQSGFNRMLQVANKIPSFDVVTFTRNDIVRSELVKSWIIAVEDTPE
jgi:phosphate starvation-inducible protein PhoH and related proteins